MPFTTNPMIPVLTRIDRLSDRKRFSPGQLSPLRVWVKTRLRWKVYGLGARLQGKRYNPRLGWVWPQGRGRN
jgi:hypothetical protein